MASSEMAEGGLKATDTVTFEVPSHEATSDLATQAPHIAEAPEHMAGETTAAGEVKLVADDKTKKMFGPRTRKSKAKQAGQVAEEDVVQIDGTGKPFRKGPVHPYEELLLRAQQMIIAHNPDFQGSKRYIIKPPQVARIGSKKVAWCNFQEICNIMQRSPDHVFHFVVAELGTDGSIAGDGQLVLKGKFGTKHIESLLRKYITEYVTCSHCRSPKTQLEKDSRTRLYNIRCSSCGASRNVTTIKSGFHAVSRADRRKAKLAK